MPVKSTWQNGEQFNASDANAVAEAVNAAYVKPGTGIPATDLSSGVQLSLGKADTAVQSVSATSITDSTTTGRSVLTAVDAAAARTALGVSYGSTSGTVVQGNDSRLSPNAAAITDSSVVGRAVLTAADTAAARTAIGVAYGTTTGTVVEGNDTRVTGAEQSVNKNTANGYAGLDANGRLPVSLLPNSVMEYQGTWAPTTNTPTLADGTGSAGDVYRVSVAGSRNLGSGSIAFDVGDYVIYNGSVWQKADTTDAVSTVAGRTGDVTLTVADIGGNTTTALGVGTVELGHASDTTLSRSAAGKLAVEGVEVVLSGGDASLGTVTPATNNAASVGYTGMPANSQSAAYTLVASDAGKHIIHPSSDNNARTFTIPANSSVAFPVGTVITFVNAINTVTIAITTDTMTLANSTTTGSRTLAANGIATAIKIGSTNWLISGAGLT